jgi:septum formation inhibitor MinC
MWSVERATWSVQLKCHTAHSLHTFRRETEKTETNQQTNKQPLKKQTKKQTNKQTNKQTPVGLDRSCIECNVRVPCVQRYNGLMAPCPTAAHCLARAHNVQQTTWSSLAVQQTTRSGQRIAGHVQQTTRNIPHI